MLKKRRLFFLRHGPTHAKGMVGWTDLPADLSDHAKIARLNTYLPQNAVVVSSDLSRARATADAIQLTRHRLPHQKDLREINFGDWEMRQFDSFKGDEAAELLRFYDQPGDISCPGGESWNDFTWRVHKNIDKILEQTGVKDIIFVVHMGVILAAVQRAMALSAHEAHAKRVEPLSITEFSEIGKTLDLNELNLFL